VKVRNFVFIAVRCFPSFAWETTLQAPLAVTGSGASGTAFPSRAWEGADTGSREGAVARPTGVGGRADFCSSAIAPALP